MTPLAITFIVNITTQVIKKYIMPKFGATGVHVLLFTFSVIAALYFTYGDQFPSIKSLLFVGAQIFCLAIALYEVVLARLANAFTSAMDTKDAA